MELLYNPDQMPKDVIIRTFVAREKLIDEFVSLIEHQPDGAGVQHSVIIAPRGMGKTTVMLMIQFAVKDRGLDDRWQVVRFREESLSITDLAGFWIEILVYLAADTEDQALLERAETLHREYSDSDDLQEAALAIIKDWRTKHGKRIVVLVENIDSIFEQINDERESSRLREVLMNDGTMILIGGATTFFHEARDYDQPLYNFFKVYDLFDLKLEQIQELLRRRAELDQVLNFEKKLKLNANRLRVMEYFTGGNPRLILMLYYVITNSDITKVKQGMEKLLDEVTPYYKAKVENLPPQQRKILDYIARVSAKTNEGPTPTGIADGTRLTVNQASAQLARLLRSGHVRAANLRERNSYYVLSEPLYAIWHQMRLGRDARNRMQWLVNFLKHWYSAEEIGAESKRLEGVFQFHLSSQRSREARDVLEHQVILAQVTDDPVIRNKAMDVVIRGCLDLKDTAAVKKYIKVVELKNLSEESLAVLNKEGYITDEDFKKAKNTLAISTEPETKSSVKELEVKIDARSSVKAKLSVQATLHNVGVELGNTGRFNEALTYFNRALELDPKNTATWVNQGASLHRLGRYEEALASFDKALALLADYLPALTSKGIALTSLGKLEEAISAFDRALEITPDDDEIWYNRGVALANLGQPKDALDSYDKALSLNPNKTGAWINRGVILTDQERIQEAVESFDRALELKNDNAEVWLQRGALLAKLGKFEEALVSFDQALSFGCDDADLWYDRGIALSKLDREEEALTNFVRVSELRPDDDESWNNRGATLAKLGRFEESIPCFEKALELRPDKSLAWINIGNALHNVGRFEEAIVSCDRALQLDPLNAFARYARGNSLFGLKRYQDAITSYDQALQIKSDDNPTWFNRGIAYQSKLMADLKEGKNDIAQGDWNEILVSAGHVATGEWHTVATGTLFQAAKLGYLEFVRKSIRDSDLEEPLFALARAIDYILTGDKALIEKLSPEIRGIVEEIVANLSKNAVGIKEPETKARPRKKKLSSRRTKRQL